MRSFELRVVRKAFAGIVFACFAGNTVSAFADVLAFWNPAGTVDTSLPVPPATVSAALQSAGNLTYGPGMRSNELWVDSYVLNNWPAGPLNTDDYLTFSTTGDNIAYSSIVFTVCNDYDGMGDWEIRSNVDDFTNNISSGSFSNIAAGVTGGETITADIHNTLGTRSGTVEFRFYTYMNSSGDSFPLQRGICGTGQTRGAGGHGLTVNGSASALTPTETSLSANPSSAASGQSIQFVASVSPQLRDFHAHGTAGKTATPGGSVTFLDGPTTLGSAPLSGSTATFSTTHLGTGTHGVVAQYSGDAAYAASTSAPASVIITAVAPSASTAAVPMLSLGGLLILAAMLGTLALFEKYGNRSRSQYRSRASRQ